MTEHYKASDAQLDWPPEAKGISWDDWIKTRPVATKADVDAFLKRIQAETADKTGKRHRGALPANTEWL